MDEALDVQDYALGGQGVVGCGLLSARHRLIGHTSPSGLRDRFGAV
jgi:hypothetical protein